MHIDPITEEIRALRHDLAAQFGNDISRILANIREREASDGRTYVTLPRRLPRTQLAEQTDPREPE
jgi:hypothetical protein